MPRISVIPEISGKFVNLREITIEDAEFVLMLRCNGKKSKHLHATENNVEKQIDYIKKYLALKNEFYFIIENKANEPIGTLRMYDIKGDCYTGGSWLLIPGATPQEALESVLLLKDFAFDVAKFNLEKFDVRKSNKKVVRFHKICGAKIVDENDIDCFFELTKEEFNKKKSQLLAMLGDN